MWASCRQYSPGGASIALHNPDLLCALTAEEVIIMNHSNLQSVPCQWLDSSPLGPFSQRYLEHLERARYARSTARVYLCCIAHFAHWISTERLALESINEAARVRFIGEHLPVCDCPYPARRFRTSSGQPSRTCLQCCV